MKTVSFFIRSILFSFIWLPSAHCMDNSDNSDNCDTDTAYSIQMNIIIDRTAKNTTYSANIACPICKEHFQAQSHSLKWTRLASEIDLVLHMHDTHTIYVLEEIGTITSTTHFKKIAKRPHHPR